MFDCKEMRKKIKLKKKDLHLIFIIFLTYFHSHAYIVFNFLYFS